MYNENLEFRVVSRLELRTKRYNLLFKVIIGHIQTKTKQAVNRHIWFPNFLDLARFDNFHSLWLELVNILLDSELNVNFDRHAEDEDWSWRWRFEELRSWLFYRKGSDQLKETNCREAGELGDGAMVKASLSLSLNWLHWGWVNWLPPTLSNCIEVLLLEIYWGENENYLQNGGGLFEWEYLYLPQKYSMETRWVVSSEKLHIYKTLMSRKNIAKLEGY